jgi:simple sugar transport system permease protein
MKASTAERWSSLFILPVLNLLTAFAFTALILLITGVDPIEAAQYMIQGAFGSQEGWGYTLYYTTNFIFTGLAVAVAFHAGLFNIGGEGQAYIGGLGVTLVALGLGAYLPAIIAIPIAILAGALLGALWAAIPAYLQAYRDSHIVITTIMFNFIAASLMVYLLVNVLAVQGQMTPASSPFPDSVKLWQWDEFMGFFGLTFDSSPLNMSLLLALLCSYGVWVLLWKTRWGYEIRTVGANPDAARYAGINPRKVIMIAMLLSGALAGLMSVNELMGVQHRLVLGFNAGAGFVGIAVSLMGRNHPVGIILAALLFGALYQGGAELAFEMNVSRDMVVVIQGLIILFSGAMEYMYRPLVRRLLGHWVKESV